MIQTQSGGNARPDQPEQAVKRLNKINYLGRGSAFFLLFLKKLQHRSA